MKTATDTFNFSKWQLADIRLAALRCGAVRFIDLMQSNSSGRGGGGGGAATVQVAVALHPARFLSLPALAALGELLRLVAKVHIV